MVKKYEKRIERRRNSYEVELKGFYLEIEQGVESIFKVVLGFLIGVYCSYNYEWVEQIVDVFRFIENIDFEKLPKKDTSE